MKFGKRHYRPQVDQMDCGVASLAMIFGYYGSYYFLAHLRELAKTTMDGTTALGLVKVAEEIGFETRAIKADMTLFDLPDLTFPFVAHVLKEGKLLHYYVVTGQDKDSIHMEENKLVKKGDLLVQYQEGAEGVQAESYASQLDMLKDQKKQLEYLQKSLQEGENHFPEEDKFGYQATFRDYISQAGSLRASTSQQNETIASQNAAASQTQAEIGNLISQTEAKIRDYQTAKSAIETGASLAGQNLAYSLYQSYKSQGEENPQTKVQAVAQVEAQISQLESSLATYRVQYAGSGTQQAYASGLSSQLESLKSQHLAKVGQELTLLAQKILEAESGKKVQGNLLDKGKVTASEDGVLHLNPETSDSSMVAEGALLAQLYPSLEREGKAKLTAYLSSKYVARIKVGDSVRYTTTHDAGNQLFLDSTITSIDATATKTEKGNFFKIEAETNLTSEQAEKLRYGVEGRLQMITGKKSYLRYYLDQFLNKE